jgi:hypothetical protein
MTLKSPSDAWPMATTMSRFSGNFATITTILTYFDAHGGTSLLGIAKGAMHYPSKFSNKARAAVEAEQIRAGRLYEKRKRQWKSDWPFPERHSLMACILNVFLTYAREAIDLGKSGVWGVDKVREEALEGLRLITIEVSFKRDYHFFIETNGGDIRPETQREFEATTEWHQFEDELLVLAKQQAVGARPFDAPASQAVEPKPTPAQPETDGCNRSGPAPISGQPEDGPTFTDSQRMLIKAAVEDFEDSLRSRERMRQFSDPGGQWVSSRAPANEFTRSVELHKLEEAVEKCVTALLDVFAEASLGLASVDLYRARVEAEADRILNWAVSQLDQKDCPFLDRRSINEVVGQRAKAWGRKVESEVAPPSWMRDEEDGKADAEKAVKEKAETSREAPAASPGKTPALHVRRGDITLLQGPDGKLKESVSFKHAHWYLGVSRRQVERLVSRKGSLIVIGGGHNKRITVASLLAYLPVENATKSDKLRHEAT